MESRSTGRFTLGKQSSLAPERDREVEAGRLEDRDGLDVPKEIESGIRLMFLTNEGDLAGIRELLVSGVDVNFRDIDGRTALHIAACQGLVDVVQLLLENGAEVDPEDRWGSTPLADAIHYKYHEVIKLLERHGAKLRIAPMHVKNAREVPEYEIDPKELDFTKSVSISKGTFQVATWRGIQVAVKKFGEDVITDEDKVWVGPILSKYFDACFLSTYLLGPSILPFHPISFSICHREPPYEFCRRAFRDELALLQQIRHPNVVQFLGAVTQSSPMMIVTEYLPKGDLCDFLKRRGALKPALAVRFALDIARGMNYLHEHKPEAIIHRDLEPSNILRDDSGCLKVADFDVSKLLKVTKTVREERPLTCQNTACRYVAPEVFRNEEYDTKVDVFSFALILQEMIEGCPPFSQKQDNEVPKAYASKERPPFRAPPKLYAHGLKELIEQCWSESPADRPTFRQIIDRLTVIQTHIPQKRHWKVRFLKCFHKIEMFKKDPSNPSSRSSRSSRSSDFF